MPRGKYLTLINIITQTVLFDNTFAPKLQNFVKILPLTAVTLGGVVTFCGKKIPNDLSFGKI